MGCGTRCNRSAVHRRRSQHRNDSDDRSIPPVTFSHAKVSQDIANLLDHLNIERAHISGYSMGGSIVLHFMLAHPDRCQTAIVGGQGWSDPTTESEGTSTRDLIVEGLERGDGIKRLLKFLAGEDAAVSDHELAARSAMFMRMNDPKAMASIVRGFETITRNDLRKNMVPTLAIVGADDPLALKKAYADAWHGICA